MATYDTLPEPIEPGTPEAELSIANRNHELQEINRQITALLANDPTNAGEMTRLTAARTAALNAYQAAVTAHRNTLTTGAGALPAPQQALMGHSSFALERERRQLQDILGRPRSGLSPAEATRYGAIVAEIGRRRGLNIPRNRNLLLNNEGLRYDAERRRLAELQRFQTEVNRHNDERQRITTEIQRLRALPQNNSTQDEIRRQQDLRDGLERYAARYQQEYNEERDLTPEQLALRERMHRAAEMRRGALNERLRRMPMATADWIRNRAEDYRRMPFWRKAGLSLGLTALAVGVGSVGGVLGAGAIAVASAGKMFMRGAGALITFSAANTYYNDRSEARLRAENAAAGTARTMGTGEKLWNAAKSTFWTAGVLALGQYVIGPAVSWGAENAGVTQYVTNAANGAAHHLSNGSRIIGEWAKDKVDALGGLPSATGTAHAATVGPVGAPAGPMPGFFGPFGALRADMPSAGASMPTSAPDLSSAVSAPATSMPYIAAASDAIAEKRSPWPFGPFRPSGTGSVASASISSGPELSSVASAPAGPMPGVGPFGSFRPSLGAGGDIPATSAPDIASIPPSAATSSGFASSIITTNSDHPSNLANPFASLAPDEQNDFSGVNTLNTDATLSGEKPFGSVLDTPVTSQTVPFANTGAGHDNPLARTGDDLVRRIPAYEHGSDYPHASKLAPTPPTPPPHLAEPSAPLPASAERLADAVRTGKGVEWTSEGQFVPGLADAVRTGKGVEWTSESQFVPGVTVEKADGLLSQISPTEPGVAPRLPDGTDASDYSSLRTPDGTGSSDYRNLKDYVAPRVPDGTHPDDYTGLRTPDGTHSADYKYLPDVPVEAPVPTFNPDNYKFTLMESNADEPWAKNDWTMADKGLERALGDEYKTLTTAQRNNIIGNLTREIERDPRHFGFTDNLRRVPDGTAVDLHELFEDRAKLDRLLDHARDIHPGRAAVDVPPLSSPVAPAQSQGASAIIREPEAGGRFGRIDKGPGSIQHGHSRDQAESRF